ncbi:MAG TPA: TIR domain-containing protein [Longimicrobium sp.]|nr:TIR domain-containing protein [Longimicrobium sp.]
MSSPSSPPRGTHPYVFISYSHDAEEHRQRVLSLFGTLRSHGVDAHLDRETLAPPQGWIRWMHDQVERADFALVVCTETYRRRAEGKVGPGTGANLEGAIIGQELYEAGLVTGKFIPVVFDAADTQFIPWFLRGRTWFDLSRPEGYDRLYRVITDQPEVSPGALGPPRHLPPIDIPPLLERAGEPAGAPPSPAPARTGLPRALVGLAIDVSGSMAESMPRSLGPSSSRIEAVRASLERIAQEAGDAARRHSQDDDSAAALFAYGFGLQIGTVCDLLTLMKVAKGVITPDEIEAVKQEVEAEARQKYAGYGDVASTLGRFLGQGAVRAAQDAARRMGESAVRSRLLALARPRIEERLARGGDTTVRIGELAALWSASGETLENAESLIFGNTPMREAFAAISARFERERAHVAADAPRVLFVLSDGEPTDGDPRPLASELLRSGVMIVSCFVTDQNVTSARTLFTAAEPLWSAGAKLMFDIASEAEPGNPFVGLLVGQGWTVPERARLFVQVNHSEVLEEFIRGLLGYAGDAGPALPPRGT